MVPGPVGRVTGDGRPGRLPGEAGGQVSSVPRAAVLAATMRVQRDGTFVPIAAEVRTIDGNDTCSSPTVEQIQ